MTRCTEQRKHSLGRNAREARATSDRLRNERPARRPDVASVLSSRQEAARRPTQSSHLRRFQNELQYSMYLLHGCTPNTCITFESTTLQIQSGLRD